ncbi:hypothetical protein EWU23_03980 [Cytophagaceae bacterium 50C-KIRBA]|uniref:DUF6695 domain-containing protein n=1 Tax=Aquirufa beregesia TaxID=2516556 RepID=A0ABX0EU84_9BACT|nr:DUF6695 family protein [Aquirufa beregesia]NGZ43628.1 hypothetical protein [Aquirufa beregesia]
MTYTHIAKSKNTLAKPNIPQNLPDSAQWLAGEGAGSWFVMNLKENKQYNISRFNPVGILECSGTFVEYQSADFNFRLPFIITYLSHCQQVTILQNNQVYFFRKINSIG